MNGFFLLSVLLVTIGIPTSSGDGGKPTNIVMILADDLGWSDVSFHGSKQVPTPNIDALALDGVILNNYYVQPSCSPSRAAFMTGRYPLRYGMQSDTILSSTPFGLPLSEKLLPEYLKSLNYATHGIGKWNLGHFKEDYLPFNRGFDTFFGYWNAAEDYFSHICIEKETYYSGYDLHDDNRTAWEYDGQYGTDIYAARAKEIIMSHDPSQPLFLYVAQQAPHSGNKWTVSVQAPDEYVDPLVGISNRTRQIYGGMLSAMDFSVGEIVEALDESGLLENTIIVFSSDNGTPVDGFDGTAGSNFPLRGGKGTLFEGAVRAVGFVWSAELRDNSRVSNGLMHISDWLPTFLSVAGASNETLKNLDGVDMWGHISDDTTSLRDDIMIFIDDFNESVAYRKGDFVLLRTDSALEDVYSDINGETIKFVFPEEPIGLLELYDNNYKKFLNESKVAQILQKNYGRNPDENLSCNIPGCETIANATEHGFTPGAPFPPPGGVVCPLSEYCLFDVINDPCEFKNVAAQNPDVVEDMKAAIAYYQQFVSKPVSVGFDPSANPVLHGGVWNPWM